MSRISAYCRVIFIGIIISTAILSGEGAGRFPFQWSSYTTYFETGIEREKNIYLAAEKLDGFILHPGSEFSFNETVTWQIPRDEFGFAPAMVDGNLLPAQGGGLCQASSTLYAAALFAGFTITERKSHSNPVRYISPGLDATVSSPEKIDLKFRNDYKTPFIIKAHAKNGALKIVFFSGTPLKNSITISTSAPARDGEYISLMTIRKTVSGEGVSSTEILSTDRYTR